MKAINYVCCALVLACALKMAHSEKSQDKMEQQFMDAYTTDESLKIKRPFCNHFTGCGKKRSFRENVASLDAEAVGSVRLPLSVYKALLRVASQNIQNTIDRDMNEYQLSDVPHVYLSGKIPLHKRLDVPSTSLE
ncbi:uncharacterized protein LOC128874771 isoform X1 [Hylaeus volcanicus]|uniref:uncharacterized protein LOC128874771 isoform X1 n=2 Tax=Hylaeus volcanicus TaxID=313075 RepID=UPI0023B856CB|nr:uncharacterized protein LOC128874771 isoform X1 [Hylaeus volcanicus]